MAERRRPKAPNGAPRAYFERMMAEGDRDGDCWLWPYAKGGWRGGYGRLLWNGRTVTVHRLAFQREYGRWPLVGRHSCDTPACFCPTHILDGTNADNMRDKIERGRAVYARGERQGHAKLADADVRAILARIAAGDRRVEIAADYDVSRGTIRCIGNGKYWGHVLDADRRDLIERGRASLWTGERNGAAKLTEADVRRIRARLAGGDTGKAIAAEYGVSRGTISDIRLGKCWAHVT